MRSSSIVLVPRYQNVYRWQVHCIMDHVPPNTHVYAACSFKKKACGVWVPPWFLLDNVKRACVSDLWLLASLQIHVLEGGEIRVYSRNSENNTSKYPDIIARMPKVISIWTRCPVLSSTSYGAFLLYIGFEGLGDILCH